VKEALEQSKDVEEAIAFLREKGVAKAAKRAGREAENGILAVYNHDGRIVVVVEVATETDFAGKSPDVTKFAQDIAVHIAAMGTEYVSVESIPEDILVQEKAAAKKDVEGKPEEVANKILEGKLQKFYKECVLTHQQLFSDDSKTVQDYLNELVGKVGEKIEITRFVKMQIAQPATACNL
jgi:elongation factor Ts